MRGCQLDGMGIAPRGAMRRQSGEDAKVLVEWLGPWLSGGGSLLFMTDYDGTLTPHVSDPGEARLAHEVQRHLTVLARTPSVRLAVVSGRDLGDVTQRVAVPQPQQLLAIARDRHRSRTGSSIDPCTSS